MVKEDIILSSDVDVGADGVGAWSATGSAPYRVSSLPLNKFQSYEVYTSYRGQNLGSCQGQPTKKSNVIDVIASIQSQSDSDLSTTSTSSRWQ